MVHQDLTSHKKISLPHLVLARQLGQLDHGAPVEGVLGRQVDAVAGHQPLERARRLPREAALGRLVEVHRPRPGPQRLQLRQRRLRERVPAVVGPHHAEGVILKYGLKDVPRRSSIVIHNTSQHHS